MKFQPMLSGEVNLRFLKYPVLLSPKLDGVRAIVRGGRLLSRSLKPIPCFANTDVSQALSEGLDGELIVGLPQAEDVFRKTMSTVMTYGGDASQVKFFVFDSFAEPTKPYRERVHAFEWMKTTFIRPVVQEVAKTPEEVMKFEEFCVMMGYEGIMLRDPDAPYKFGRSTTKEGYLLKMKRFQDDEAKVVGFEEQLRNDNPLTHDAMGYAERSSHQANMVPKGTLGALITKWNGQELRIGTGFDDALRKRIWDNKPAFLGLTVKFKYWQVVKDLPRHPVFLGFVE